MSLGVLVCGLIHFLLVVSGINPIQPIAERVKRSSRRRWKLSSCAARADWHPRVGCCRDQSGQDNVLGIGVLAGTLLTYAFTHAGAVSGRPASALRSEPLPIFALIDAGFNSWRDEMVMNIAVCVCRDVYPLSVAP